jgi:tetratricopeptide (TPR) repeat protein
LTADFPAVPEYRNDLAASHHSLGRLLADLGERAKAEGEYRDGLAVLEKLVAEFPAAPAYRAAQATGHGSLGLLLAGLGERAAAEGEFRKALALLDKLTADHPTVPEYRLDLSKTHGGLGSLLLHQFGRREAAEGEYRKGLALVETLATDFPEVPHYQVDLGLSYCNFGVLVSESGRPSDALPWFDKAIRVLTAAHDRDRRPGPTAHALRDTHSNRAVIYGQLRKHAEAVQDWDAVVRLTPTAEQPSRRAIRATARLRAGQVPEAVAEVAELRRLTGWPADFLYGFATVYSVASAEVADEKRNYADRAMETLQKAVKAGWKDAARVKTDPDLDPLRGREDFRKLLAELEAKFPPKAEVLPAPRKE